MNGPSNHAARRAIRLGAVSAICAVLAMVAALAIGGACSRAPKRPNVLLITIDTWRADRLSANGSPRVTTPNLDRLAKEGVRFTRVTVPRAKTTPAIASLLTGLYPHDHGVRELMQVIAGERTMLQERLRAAGYRTGAIVGNFVLKDSFCGFARGFDVWCDDLSKASGVPPDDVPQRSARSLTDGALRALGLPGATETDMGPRESVVRGDRPWFLWLHYMDPHGAYDPPADHRVFRTTSPDPVYPVESTPELLGAREKRWIAEYNVPAVARMPDGAIDAALVRDLYDGEVHYADAQIGRLLDALRASGALDDTLVVVTSDHGESLGEQDYWFEHGRNVSEATCRVPLVVFAPRAMRDARAIAPGARDGDVSIADVGPTILDLLGLPPLAPGAGKGVQGVSRAPLLARDDPAVHPVFSEKVDRGAQNAPFVQYKVVRAGPWKLVRRYAIDPRAKGGVDVLGDELYDVGRDPFETQDRIDDPPPEAPLARLRAELLRFSAADVRFADIARELEAERAALEARDPETVRILEALGY